jgi:ubiquinone/menaquinone biosynthesis C-methylase UbiE
MRGETLYRALPRALLSLCALLALPAGAAEDHGAHRTFDDPSAYSQSWDDPGRDAWQRPAELVAALDVQPGMAVADIGTGTGYLLPHLSRAAGEAGRVFAVDISSAMLDWVKERAAREGMNNVVTVVASGSATGLPAESLDRAIMINVWHHIEDPEAYARDLHRVMRPHAVLFIVEAHPEADHRGGPPRHFRLAPEAVVQQLQRAGWRAELDPFQIDRQFVVRAER